MHTPLILMQHKLICKLVHKSSSSIVEPMLVLAEGKKEKPWQQMFNDWSIGWLISRMNDRVLLMIWSHSCHKKVQK